MAIGATAGLVILFVVTGVQRAWRGRRVNA
jgi:hypothetical protein